MLEGYYFDAQYIDGNESSGKVGSDVVALGTISAPVQVFGVPDSVSAGFLQAPDDGKLGLAFIVLSSGGSRFTRAKSLALYSSNAPKLTMTVSWY